jgi:hypothetical protein
MAMNFKPITRQNAHHHILTGGRPRSVNHFSLQTIAKRPPVKRLKYVLNFLGRAESAYFDDRNRPAPGRCQPRANDLIRSGL